MEPDYNKYMAGTRDGGGGGGGGGAAAVVRVAGDATPDYIWANLRYAAYMHAHRCDTLVHNYAT